MKKTKRYAALSCSILLLTASLTACNSSASMMSNTSTVEDTINSILETLQSTGLEYGKVTAINGSTITLALGELSGGGGMRGDGPGGSQTGDNPGGNAPDGAAQSGEASNGEAPSGEAPEGGAPNGDTSGGEAPTGEAPGREASGKGTTNGDSSGGEAPTGEVPSGDASGGKSPAGGMGNTFTENGETQTLTITDESIIKVQNGTEISNGSLSDIQVGTIVSLEYADDGSLSTLTVQQTDGAS